MSLGKEIDSLREKDYIAPEMNPGDRFVNIHTGRKIVFVRTEIVQSYPSDIEMHIFKEDPRNPVPPDFELTRLNNEFLVKDWKKEDS